MLHTFRATDSICNEAKELYSMKTQHVSKTLSDHLLRTTISLQKTRTLTKEFIRHPPLSNFCRTFLKMVDDDRSRTEWQNLVDLIASSNSHEHIHRDCRTETDMGLDYYYFPQTCAIGCLKPEGTVLSHSSGESNTRVIDVVYVQSYRDVPEPQISSLVF